MLQNAKFKEKKKGKKETTRRFPQQGIDQHDNHYTTPIADSVNEIKYLYR